MSKIKLTPLLPRHKIYLRAWDDNVVAERFAEQFRLAWRELPLYARRRILRYWRGSSRGSFEGTSFSALPLEVQKHLVSALIGIELVDDLRGIVSIHGEGHWLHRERRFAFSECANRGHLLRFWTPAVKAMPDDVLRGAIVYELTSVYWWRQGRNFDAVSIWEMPWISSTADKETGETSLEAWTKGPNAEALLRQSGMYVENDLLTYSMPFIHPSATSQPTSVAQLAIQSGKLESISFKHRGIQVQVRLLRARSAEWKMVLREYNFWPDKNTWN